MLGFSTICKHTLDTEHVFSYNRFTTLVLANMFAASCRLGVKLGAAAVTKGQLQCAPQTLYRTGKKKYWAISKISCRITATRRRSGKFRRSLIFPLRRWSPTI